MKLGLTLFPPPGTLIPKSLAYTIQQNVANTLFKLSVEYGQRDDAPPVSTTLASYLYSPSSPLFDNLHTATEREFALSLAQSWSTWTATDFNNVSLRYWGYARDFEGPSAFLKQGYGQFIEWMRREAETSGRVRIKLSHEVVAIRRVDGGVSVTTHFKSSASSDPVETTFIAQTCICTIPLGVLKSARPVFDPPLPSRWLASIHRLGFGEFTKIFISYSVVWWPKSVPFFYIILPDTVTSLKHHNTFDENTHAALLTILSQKAVEVRNFAEMNGAPVLNIDFGPPAARALEQYPTDAVKAATHAIFAHYFTGEGKGNGLLFNPPAPEACVVTRWNLDPFSRGSYSFIPVAQAGDALGPATPLDFIELSKPLWDGRLGFAGEHTDMDHFASAHGALLSGIREANRLEYLLPKLQPLATDVGKVSGRKWTTSSRSKLNNNISGGSRNVGGPATTGHFVEATRIRGLGGEGISIL